MRRMRRYMTRIILFLVAVGAACIPLYPAIERAFMANPVLNGLILGVLIVGIIFEFRQIIMLQREAGWLMTYQREGDVDAGSEPRLLAPMASLLREKRGRVSLSALSMRSILDSIGSRLDEVREISRYLVGLLIFLGLLGTFWGLLGTISAISGTIDGLSVTASDFATMFEELKSGLEAPLSGMGTAFSSSLFGLGGSLVLGFVDLQTGQAQNRFYNDLEDWLSSVTTLSGGGALAEGEGDSAPAYVTALLEQTAESINDLQRTFERAEQSRNRANAAILELTEKLANLGDHMRSEQSVLKEMISQQRDSGMDDASREHLRSIDVHLHRLLEDASAGRDQLSRDVRGEIKLLARTISNIAGDRQQSPD